jgi:hypothetical protein
MVVITFDRERDVPSVHIIFVMCVSNPIVIQLANVQCFVTMQENADVRLVLNAVQTLLVHYVKAALYVLPRLHLEGSPCLLVDYIRRFM